MIVSFAQEYLKELFVKGRCSDKKHRFQPQIVKRYQRRVEQLMGAPSPEHLYQLHSLNFEALRGDKSGMFSIRVNDQYRIEFTINRNAESEILSICNIIELSNHYD